MSAGNVGAETNARTKPALGEGVAGVLRQRPGVYGPSLEGTPLHDRFVVEVPGGHGLPGTGADGMPDGPARALFEDAVLAITPLDGTSVICEPPGCDKPALYLLSVSGPSFVAHCEAHARQFADKVRITLPPVKESVSRRPYRATA